MTRLIERRSNDRRNLADARKGMRRAYGVGVVAIEFDAIPVAASATLRTQREPPAGLKAANVMVECHVRV
jgi:hypothetical protein